ncbi:MAG: ribosome-associated translation inhibitor RaiA [Paludibacteraceae bacterium]|nr:ribosome-associated translation inhibitor RaiA [Paludibacteraceae bacterium]
MEVKINAVKFEPNEKLQQFIQKKVAKVERWDAHAALIDVTMKLVKPETNLNKEVQINFTGSNGKFFASKTCDTFEEALDLSLEALERQVKKAKDKE